MVRPRAANFHLTAAHTCAVESCPRISRECHPCPLSGAGGRCTKSPLSAPERGLGVRSPQVVSVLRTAQHDYFVLTSNSLVIVRDAPLLFLTQTVSVAVPLFVMV